MCGRADWFAAASSSHLRPASLVDEGFIHLSTPQQVHLPANRLFGGRSDIVLLLLDARLLNAPVRWEPGVREDPQSMVFPHLYGQLPVAAVIDVVDYVPNADGLFTPPAL